MLFFVGLSLIMLSVAGKAPLAVEKDKVGVVEVNGLIYDAKTTLKNLDRFSEKNQVKAIVLRINSPGGAVGPAQEIVRELEKIRPKKKVLASLGTIAASGGYYIASAADLIMSNPGTLTGSIGVIMNFTNFEQLMNKVGLDFYNLKSGKYKDIGNPSRPMTPDEKLYIQTLIDNVHEQFIQDVAKGRKLPLEKVRPLADGRIFTGQEALNLGMVDLLGNFEDAVEKAGRLGGIKGKVEAIYPPKDKFSLLDLLTGESLDETLSRLQLASPVPAYLFAPGK
jgi:protease-4